MTKFIALLRGVNVGGNNIISMAKLKESFEHAGFSEVKTYINSGNMVFCSDFKNDAVLKDKCETIIKDTFQLNISLAIISSEELKEALKNAPSWWDALDTSKSNAIFVIHPLTAPEAIKLAGETDDRYEQVSFHGKVIFWSAPLKTYSRTKWSKITGKEFNSLLTIRNANTAKKLGQL